MKKIIKKLMLVVAMTVLCMTVTMTASAIESTGQCGDNVYWSYNDDTKELTVSGEGDMWDYGYYDNVSPFKTSDIKSVVIMEGITGIGQHAFADCNEMEKIAMPKTLETVGEKAFMLCNGIKELDFSQTNLKYIKEGAFAISRNLKVMSIPKSLEYLGSGSFFTTYLDYIYYEGTESEWLDLIKNYEDSDSPAYLQIPTIVFVDGSHMSSFAEEITLAPTCTENGTKLLHCSCGCTYTKTETIPALGHKETVISGKAPTCTESGLTDGLKCSVCGETFIAQKEIPMLKHSSEIITPKAPTCTESGLTDGLKCSFCGEILVAQEVINPVSHKDENGDYFCDFDCGYEFENPADSCEHFCHNEGFAGFFAKIIIFFWKLFKINPVCSCGVAHY